MILGVLPRGPISGFRVCSVIAIILPMVWLGSRRARGKGNETVVCDACNRVKLADEQPACTCGGRYVPLAEMNWVNPEGPGTALRKSA
jgi:hypothetical protein